MKRKCFSCTYSLRTEIPAFLTLEQSKLCRVRRKGKAAKIRQKLATFHQNGTEYQIFRVCTLTVVFWQLPWKWEPLITLCRSKTHDKDTKAHWIKPRKHSQACKTFGEGSERVVWEGEEDTCVITDRGSTRESSSKWPFHLHASAASYIWSKVNLKISFDARQTPSLLFHLSNLDGEAVKAHWRLLQMEAPKTG